MDKNRKEFKRLFFDIETSPNLVTSWNIGRKINIDYDNIVKERAIICICWKWEGEKTVNHLTWNKGDDKAMLKQFAEIIGSADESIGHNGDQYDLKWLKARCIYHGIPMMPKYQTVDTLKLARQGFRFNSNRLDYLGKFLGLGRKADTGGFGLWKDIVFNNGKASMDKMVKYCKQDVLLLENVFEKLKPYTPHKTHVGVFLGKDKHSCPECASSTVQSRGYSVTAGGNKKQRLHCQSCGKWWQVAIKKPK